MKQNNLLYLNRLLMQPNKNVNLQGYSSKKNFKYSIYFTSLLAPHFSKEQNFFQNTPARLLPKKLHLKKSYLALSWFYYIHTMSSPFASPESRFTKPKLSVLPSKRSLYTLTKAPMAHKTNSKEQFMFKFYFFKFSFFNHIDLKLVPSSLNSALLLFYLIKRSFPIFETNLLFIKYYHVQFLFHDNTFFNFYDFHKRSLR